jgi:hypothetical protein
MSKRRSHHLWFLLAVSAAVGLLAWLWPRGDAPAKLSNPSQSTPPHSVNNHSAAMAAQQPAAVPAEITRADGKRELQAYRIAVKGGVLSLDGTERIAGDFHRRRGPQAWMPGMWCVRLLDAEGRVLAEETAQAPDEVCLVGDPRNLGANGLPQATQFAGAGEEAMLQVRLPPHPDARMLKVYRIGGLERADWDTEPMGRLLATLSLP